MSTKDFQLLGVSMVKDPVYKDAKIKTTVVNVRIDECDTYIGRGSKWGQSFCNWCEWLKETSNR